MATDVNAIVVAHRGRVAMLAAVFGGGSAPAAQAEPISQELYDRIFG